MGYGRDELEQAIPAAGQMDEERGARAVGVPRFYGVENLGVFAGGSTHVFLGRSAAELDRAHMAAGEHVFAEIVIETEEVHVPGRLRYGAMKGYVGEACPECANFTLVRNGTCLKCETCGSTTGCS